MTWLTVPLGEVSRVDARTVQPHEIGPETTYVGLEHIGPEGALDSRQTAGAANLKSAKNRFDERHVLFGKLRPNLGKVARPTFPGVSSTDIYPILPSERIDRDYLGHLLLRPESIAFASSRTTGVNLPRISWSSLRELPTPLPPLPEQRRIAAILDEADALRRVSAKVLSRLAELRRANFHLVARSGTASAKIGDVAALYGGSSLPQGRRFNGEVDGYLLVKVSDMNAAGNEVVITHASEWSAAPGARAATAPAGATLLPKRGAAIATNKKRILGRPAIIDPNLMAVAGVDGLLHFRWLHAWFESFDLTTIQSGSTVPQLNKQDLTPLDLPLPSWDEQLEFAQRMESLDRQSAILVTRCETLDALFASLQHRAFRGEL